MIKLILILLLLPNCLIAQFQQNSNYLDFYYYCSNINDYNNKKIFIDSLILKLNNEKYFYIYNKEINIKDSLLFKNITNEFEYNNKLIINKIYRKINYYYYIQNYKHYRFYTDINNFYNNKDSLIILKINYKYKLIYNIYNYNIEIYKITENYSIIIQKIKYNVKQSELVNIIFNYSKIKQEED